MPEAPFFVCARARCLSAGLRYLRLTRLPRHDRGPIPGGNRSAASCPCTVLRRASYHYGTRSPKACQKLRRIPDVPPPRITDLENAARQLRQLSCILDSCTISASYEVREAQKALLLMPRTAKGASTSSEELNAQMSLPTDDE